MARARTDTSPISTWRCSPRGSCSRWSRASSPVSYPRGAAVRSRPRSSSSRTEEDLMDFIPIISTLRRHRTASILIILEIAFTCAIVCIGKKTDPGVVTRQDLEALKAVPGVKSVAVTNMVPFGGSSWNTSVSTIPDDPHAPINVATYMGSRDLIETLGAKIIAGRDFNPEEYIEYTGGGSNVRIPSILITKGVAERMFLGETNVVGKNLYVWGKDPSTIDGVIDTLARPKDFQGPVGFT